MAAADLGLSDAAANAACDAVVDLLNSGLIRIYSGTRPVNANTAIAGNTLGAQLTFNATAFGAASAGVATANAISDDTSADATITATWFRVLDSGGVDVTDNIFDGNVDTSGGDLDLNTTAIQAGATVSITAMTYTQPLT
jgi:hypothetical protein